MHSPLHKKSHVKICDRLFMYYILPYDQQNKFNSEATTQEASELFAGKSDELQYSSSEHEEPVVGF